MKPTQTEFSKFAPLVKEGLLRLGRWYPEHKRDLPWRKTNDPYRIWVSEIMLQQTRVEAVKDYYRRFLASVDSLEALANAKEETLLKLWEGLGYYSRVKNMKKAAVSLVEQGETQLPASYEKLRSLCGIGDYTAGAVASIAFGIPVSTVDGNVLRILSRLCGSTAPVDLDATKKGWKAVCDQLLVELAEETPDFSPGDYNQGMMELGATVCLPNGEPLCEKCPWQEICASRLGGWRELPQKEQKKGRTIEKKTLFLLKQGDNWLLHKRPEKGLLAGLWEIPSFAGHLNQKKLTKELMEFGVEPERIFEISSLPSAKHIFTHKEWEMTAFLVKLDREASLSLPEGYRWVSCLEMETTLPLPAAFLPYRPFFSEK